MKPKGQVQEPFLHCSATAHALLQSPKTDHTVSGEEPTGSVLEQVGGVPECPRLGLLDQPDLRVHAATVLADSGPRRVHRWRLDQAGHGEREPGLVFWATVVPGLIDSASASIPECLRLADDDGSGYSKRGQPGSCRRTWITAY